MAIVHSDDAVAAVTAEPGVYNIVDDDPLPVAERLPAFARWVNLSFAPPTCRMPLGQSQDIPRADPGGRVTPRF